MNSILIQHGLDLMSLVGTLSVFGLAGAIGQLAFAPLGDVQYRWRHARRARPALRAVTGGARSQLEGARSAA